MARVEQNRYKTNNGCIKHLPQTGYKHSTGIQFNVNLYINEISNLRFELVIIVFTTLTKRLIHYQFDFFDVSNANFVAKDAKLSF